MVMFEIDVQLFLTSIEIQHVWHDFLFLPHPDLNQIGLFLSLSTVIFRKWQSPCIDYKTKVIIPANACMHLRTVLLLVEADAEMDPIELLIKGIRIRFICTDELRRVQNSIDQNHLLSFNIIGECNILAFPKHWAAQYYWGMQYFSFCQALSRKITLYISW